MFRGKMISDLSDDLLVNIFSYCGVEEIAFTISNVCTKWKKVTNNPKLWKRLRYSPSLGKTDEDSIIEVLKKVPHLQWPMPWTMFSNKVILTLSQYCKDIRELHLYESSNDMLHRLVTECPNVERISLQYLNYNNTKAIKIISKYKNLKHIKLSGHCTPRQKHLLKPIARGCPALESLDIQYLMNYEYEDIMYLLEKKGKQLCCINLYCCHFVDKKCVGPAFYHYCTQLKYVKLNMHASYEKLIAKVSRVCGTKFCLKYFATNHAKLLKKLDLHSFGSFDKTIAQCIFENCKYLEVLCLDHVTGLDDECLKSINELKFLTTFKCEYNSELTDQGVAHIVRCSSLKCLSLIGCSLLTSYSFQLCCYHLKLLESLSVSIDKLTEEYLLPIPDLLKNLTCLRLFKKGLFSDRVPLILKRNMPKLEFYYL